MKPVVTMAGLAIALLLTGPATAEVRRGGGGESAQAQAAVQNLLRQASAERDALAQEKAQLQQALDAAKQALGASQQKLAASDEALVKFQAANGELSGYVEQQSGKLQEMAGKFQALVNSLKQSEQQRTALEAQLAEARQALDSTRADNAKLVNIGEELMKQYEQKGVWTSLLQKEPLTQLKRVEIENLMEKYRVEIHRAAVEQPKS